MKQLMQKDMDELARYIDGELSEKDRKNFEDRLNIDKMLQEKFASVMELHEMLKSQHLLSPSKNFTEKVMDNLDHYSSPTASFSIRNGLLLLTGVLVAGLLALYLAGSGVFDGPVTIMGPVDSMLSQQLLQRQLPAVTFNGKILVNAIVLLNLVLAWIVLDRTILRPWFSRRVSHG
ncbi:hypothetical protein WBG78_06160 [Chryseolinea sp. T2]|uniref:anti-sigma factor family protein n=1 Tax=Chryseolinea sp. T2 TaxID=3129255 RepID=UPI0030788856